MLRLVNVSKIYEVANTKVHALKKINVSFRKNEFVSILGASGSGKTTLLNIVGGLDKYTSGDLFICGKSTKEFKDRDWDHYRNLRIGFIFQSYNLIPHQTVLSNVELALTISGIKKEERIERAKKALDEVGLTDQYYKKPNQLSGGQCQRVAIARALVNDPEILLADEPTGALDTKTSVQIMDLIKKIAKDRLVIMVTHNPELAEKYSNRIINLKDGEIISDSNEYSSEDEIQEVHQLSDEQINKQSKAKMSFITAFKLSFKNLLSKFKRTLLVSIASSIGIIGVSAVLAVSFGITDYTTNMQDDMLSSYPIQIAEEAVDLGSLTTGLDNNVVKEAAKFDITTQVGMQSMVNFLMEKYSDITNVKTNDINEYLVKYIDDMPEEYISAKKYNYGIDITNNIFCKTVADEHTTSDVISLNGLTQRYIAELKTVKGFSNYASYVDLFTNFMKQMPDNNDYILNQYDLLGNSKMAEEENEIMIVVDKNTTLTDLLLAQMGYYSHDEFINIAKKSIEVNDARKAYENKIITKEEYERRLAKADEDYPYRTVFEYDDLIGSEFYYLPGKTLWEYGNVSTDIKYGGSVVHITDNTILYLSYMELMGNNVLAGYKIPVLGGGEPQQVAFVSNVEFEGAPEISADVTHKETMFNGTWVGIDTSNYQSTGDVLMVTHNGDLKKTMYMPNGAAPEMDSSALIEVTESGLVNGFNYPAVANDEWINNLETYGGFKVKVAGILRAKESVQFGCLSRGVYYNEKLTNKYMNDGISDDNKIVSDPILGFKTYFQTPDVNSARFPAYVTFSYLDYTDEKNPVLTAGGYAYALNGDLSNSISSMFSSITGRVDYSEQNVVYLRSLCGYKACLDEDTKTYEFNKLPQEISLYPSSFSDKDKVTNYLNKWNEDGDISITLPGETEPTVLHKTDRKDLTYTDTVQLIVTLINTLIRIITVSLVAFTSLSLVVSCFMIAVITYISVMERVKEIGVIRSLGGRKKDVARLFTAENLLTGLASGILGIVITYVLSIILNSVIRIFGIPAIAALPWWVAIIMILLSIALSVLSGFIPSRNASKQDPVNALRSE